MAWEKTFKTAVSDLKKEQIWKVWENVNEWHTWDHDIEYAKLTSPFAEGSTFTLRPKGGPNVRLQITDFEKHVRFTDRANFLLAHMESIHHLQETPQGVELTHTIRVTGPLTFLWKKLVAENVANGIPEQTQRLLEKARLQS